jgi:hypothetical protein
MNCSFTFFFFTPGTGKMKETYLHGASRSFYSVALSKKFKNVFNYQHYQRKKLRKTNSKSLSIGKNCGKRYPTYS